MVHIFTFDDLNIAYDAHSGSLHVVDDMAGKILQLYSDNDKNTIIENLSRWYSAGEVEETYGEIQQMVDSGVLFSRDYMGPAFDPGENSVVKAMCLHLAHDCNMRCRYCFAGQGPFGMDRTLMSRETGQEAIDFLLEISGPRKHVEVDFFGGEPLLNFNVMKDLVEYGKKQAAARGKEIKFTVTTNAVLLKGDIKKFIGKEGMDIVLSLDGRPEVQNAMRPFINGGGTYDTVSKNIVDFLRGYPHLNYYVRGTFTRNNLDFTEDVLHMKELGLESLSLEPAVGGEGEDFSLREEDLPRVYKEYEHLARTMYDLRRENNRISFFHFNVDLEGGPCLKKRLSNCGAGNEYIAVTPQGEIYPCHQFVGKENFKMGHTGEGKLNENIMNYFLQAHLYNKERCPDCWAKFLCSGGCHASAYESHGDIYSPHEFSCKLMKKRLECALYLKARELLDN